jgi:toxin ParE1/3/4
VSGKPVVPRDSAQRDMEDAVDHYVAPSGLRTALGFIDAVERAFGHIAVQPASGSPRYAHELELPGLRSWPLKRYPYLVFYLERDDHIDVWRVLHGRRDIPVWMQSDPSP